MPAFFIVGVGRSGTTLARAIVSGHPDLEVSPETGFLPKLMRLQALWWGSQGVRPRILTRLAFANGRLARAGLRPSQVCARLEELPPTSPAEAVSRIYELFAEGASVRVGDKTPGYVDHVQRLGEAFPSSQFLHMVRHPLDVVASLARQPWGPNDPLAGGQLWLRSLRSYSRVSLAGDRLLVIRLEDLVSSPSTTVSRISSHLGVQPHPDMLRFADRAEQISAQNIHPGAHEGLSRPLGATRSWSEDLSADDAVRTWSLVADAAEPLGYIGPNAAGRAVRGGDAMARLALFQLARSWRRGRTAARLLSR